MLEISCCRRLRALWTGRGARNASGRGSSLLGSRSPCCLRGLLRRNSSSAAAKTADVLTHRLGDVTARSGNVSVVHRSHIPVEKVDELHVARKRLRPVAQQLALFNYPPAPKNVRELLRREMIHRKVSAGKIRFRVANLRVCRRRAAGLSGSGEISHRHILSLFAQHAEKVAHPPRRLARLCAAVVARMHPLPKVSRVDAQAPRKLGVTALPPHKAEHNAQLFRGKIFDGARALFEKQPLCRRQFLLRQLLVASSRARCSHAKKLVKDLASKKSRNFQKITHTPRFCTRANHGTD